VLSPTHREHRPPTLAYGASASRPAIRSDDKESDYAEKYQGQQGYVQNIIDILKAGRTLATTAAATAVAAAVDFADDGALNFSPADLDDNGVVGDLNGDGELGTGEMMAIAAVAVGTLSYGARMANAYRRSQGLPPLFN